MLLGANQEVGLMEHLLRVDGSNRVERIANASFSITHQPSSGFTDGAVGVLEVFDDAVEHANAVIAGREQATDVFHDEDGGREVGDNLQVFEVQGMPGFLAVGVLGVRARAVA